MVLSRALQQGGLRRVKHNLARLIRVIGGGRQSEPFTVMPVMAERQPDRPGCS